MIGNKVSKQEGGENSTNLQGQSIVVHQGISYEDAKNIAIDVFKANCIELSQKAAETARQRVEELVDDFLGKLKERSPASVNSMEDPGVQHAIFTATREYAKTGDKDLSDMLVDILVDRAAQTERDLKQIVLDESLSVVPKLTTSQLDTLTVVFILRYTKNHLVNSIPALKSYLTTYIAPFANNLSKEHSLYQHLEFAGCGSISVMSTDLQNVFQQKYKGLFCLGFTAEQVQAIGISEDQQGQLFVNCLHDSEKLQLNAMDDEVLITRAKEAGLNDEYIEKLNPLINGYQMDPQKTKEILQGQGDFMIGLFDIWENSDIKSLTLTSVGISIASANLRRKTNITLDLSIWIK